MPIEVSCPSCTRQFRVPDKVAGKKIKCPKCQGVLPVPGPGSGVGSSVGVGSGVGAASGSQVTAGGKWYMKTADGAQYGPVPKSELDQWQAEGRITPECQLLEEGSPQWQWATDVYPAQPGPVAAAQNLVQAAAPAPAAAAPAPAPAPASNDNPFAGLGDSSAPAATGGAAPASDPFTFAGADTSPTSRLRGGRRGGGGKRRGGRRSGGPRSGMVTSIAVMNYIFGGLGVMLGLFIAIAGPMIMGMFMGLSEQDFAQSANPQQAAEAAEAVKAAGSIGSVIFILVGVGVIVMSSINLLAGYGIQIRAQWGKILTLVLGGLNVAGGLMNLVMLNPFALINIAYGIFVFVILLNRKYAEEFR